MRDGDKLVALYRMVWDKMMKELIVPYQPDFLYWLEWTRANIN